MKVIFLDDVTNVADVGDIKEVANGYAKNYLFPNKLAVAATRAEILKLESRHKSIAVRRARKEEDASGLAQKLQDITVVLKVKAGEKGRIYGSVTNADIAEELKRTSGYEIDKRKIDLTEPIRELSSRQVPIKLTSNVIAKVNVIVEQEQQESEE